MATFAQIKDRIITKYKSLPNQKEKLEFLYEVQERLRVKHNEKGADFRANTITKDQWDNFTKKWNVANSAVAEQIAKLRDKVFVEDYELTVPTDQTDAVNTDAWGAKKEAIKAAINYKSDIDTIWQ